MEDWDKEIKIDLIENDKLNKKISEVEDDKKKCKIKPLEEILNNS